MSAMTLFSAPSPRVFTVAPHRPFLDDLAAALLKELADPKDPFALADAIVLVPNRRAVRELGSAFVRIAGADPPPATLLPAIRALGDIEEDEPPFEPGRVGVDAPPAVSSGRRRFELGALLHARNRALDPSADPAAALAMADDLGRLLDEAAAARADIAAVRDELLDRLPGHLQQSAVFLDIVLAHWPDRLKELGRIDAAGRRELVLKALADTWIAAPPKTPVIAAGSTGSQAATRAVLAAVARLPMGAVVLPGVDVDLDERAWEAVDDGHPQQHLKRTLADLGVARAKVRLWPGSAEGRAAQSRRRLINEALRPAAATDDWVANVTATRIGRDIAGEGLKGLALIEAPTPDAEARAVALAVREALEAPDASVLVVTPDLGLADRIASALQRFGVEADLSAGRPLIETMPGAFLAHVLALAQDPGDPVALCALAKHELFALGRSRFEARRRFAEVERAGLRGVRAGPDLAALLARLEKVDDRGKPAASEEARALVGDLSNAFAAMLRMTASEDTNLPLYAVAHVATAEAIARDERFSGADRIWREEAGEAAASLMRELIEESESFPRISFDAYARIFQRLARARSVRGRGEDARVRILGPLEARLQSADLVVAAGLNEGTWPARPAEDPFLSREMRRKAGLPAPERRLSLAAHDFAQLACAPRVLLSRSLRDDAGPTVASRWLWRLQTLARGAGARSDAIAPARDYLGLAAGLDRVAPEEARPVVAPEARPPVAARPRRLSATRVEEWVRDPYGLYARRVLGLRRLDPLDKPPGPLERGNAVHEALEVLVRAHPDDLPQDFSEQLAEAAIASLEARGFTHAELACQAPRVRRAAAWFARWERERRAAGWRPALLEAKGEASFDAPAGPFVVEAKADRIDAGPAGASILDYKTGAAPTDKQAKQGLSPQLGVEAVIAMLGGFEGRPKAPPAELVYVRVSGGRTPGVCRVLFEGDRDYSVARHAEATLEGLRRYAEKYDDPDTPYLSRIRIQKLQEERDFDRLARVKEWATPTEDEP
jgi:ATP-dependent helicase/nuclease subunit B